jgi:hypothetical protein
VVAAAVVLLAAGCGGPVEEPGLPQAPGTISAGFLPGGEVDVVVVTAVDRRAILSAVLKPPGGAAIPAYSISSIPQPQRAATAPGLISSTLYTGMPLGNPTAVTTYDQTVSTASIRIPDPEVYRKTWPRWTVEVVMGVSPSERRTVSQPAPQPP